MNVLPNGYPIINLSIGVANALKQSIESPKDPLISLLDKRGNSKELTPVPINKEQLDRIVQEFVIWYAIENNFIICKSIFNQIKALRKHFENVSIDNNEEETQETEFTKQAKSNFIAYKEDDSDDLV